MKQINNLSQYFKLEDFSLEKKISEKSQTYKLKSPEAHEVQDKA